MSTILSQNESYYSWSHYNDDFLLFLLSITSLLKSFITVLKIV